MMLEGSFPYSEPGYLDLTGTNASSGKYYYYFYDWEIEASCESARTEVPGTILCVGMDNITKTQIKIYPNPTTGIFNIRMEKTDGDVTLEVFNALGQKVMGKSISDFGGGLQTTVDITGQPTGMYSLRLTTSTTIYSYTLVIQ